jgi:hypothetical protein
MWAIITNRLLLGVVIGFAWAFTHHPVCGFPIPWYVRGVFAGVVVSLTLAFSWLAANGVVSIFWYTLLAWAVYGLVIDFFATKFGWEGKEIAG